MSELINFIESTLDLSLDGIPSEKIVRVLAFVGAELIAVIILAIALNFIIRFGITRLKEISSTDKVANADNIAHRLERFRKASRFVINLLATLLIFGLLGFDGWTVWQGEDPLDKTLGLFQKIPADTWKNLAWATVKIIAAIYLAKKLIPKIVELLSKVESKALKFGSVHTNDRSISAFFSGLTSLIVNASWALIAIFASTTLSLPADVYAFLLKAVTVYLIIGLALIIVRTVTVIVETLDAFSHKYAKGKDWYHYYNALRPLIPLFRRCLEAAIWLITATLVLAQLNLIPRLAAYGPRLLQVIVIFFIARVIIELGCLLIDQTMLGDDDLSEDDRKRRTTIAPLFKSIFTQVCYFIAMVIILGALGIDIMPFLAGAGILGVVIGLGAQPLINDVVSGFFILFENIFLVGDFVEIEGRRGTVVSIDFRTTKLRDPDGNVSIIRNGDMRAIKSYSKDFTYAVVEVRAAYHNEVETVRNALQECGRQVQQEMPEFVTDDLIIRGITEFGQSAIHYRTVTPVIPHHHYEVETRLREIIKAKFEEKGIEIPLPQYTIRTVEE